MARTIPFNRLELDTLASSGHWAIIDIRGRNKWNLVGWYQINSSSLYGCRRRHTGGISGEHKRTPICREFTEQLLVWAQLQGWRPIDDREP